MDEPFVTLLAQRMTVAGLSDVGLRRSHNEDGFGIRDDLGLILVADGMGGHGDGAQASAMAIKEIFRFIEDCTLGQPSTPNIRSIIQSAVEGANKAIYEINRERQREDGAGMGTTVVGMWVLEDSDRCAVFNVGDSRLYRIRQGVCAQMTRDHSAYQAWIDDGRSGAEPRKNIIMRALGPVPHVTADIRIEELMNDDIFLLCSDGLTGMVDDRLIADTLSTHANPESACRRLVDLANENGGVDNITAVVARWRG